jgi:hypothetical protein
MLEKSRREKDARKKEVTGMDGKHWIKHTRGEGIGVDIDSWLHIYRQQFTGSFGAIGRKYGIFAQIQPFVQRRHRKTTVKSKGQ